MLDSFNIFYITDVFEMSAFKEKQLVEKVFFRFHMLLLFTFNIKVGWQTQTSKGNPNDLTLRRAVLGPDMYFTAEGKIDKEPIHY